MLRRFVGKTQDFQKEELLGLFSIFYRLRLFYKIVCLIFLITFGVWSYFPGSFILVFRLERSLSEDDIGKT